MTMASVQGRPPRLGDGKYAKEDVREFLQAYQIYEREFRAMEDEERTPVPIKYPCPEAYLRVTCKPVFQGGKNLDDANDNDVKAALKRAAGMMVELPDGLRFLEE